jgi:hypothetical protein
MYCSRGGGGFVGSLEEYSGGYASPNSNISRAEQ